MDQQKTLFDKFLSRIKNNPVVAVLLVIGTIVITTATFTDATQKILVFFTKEEAQNVAGKWRTQVLINPYDESERSMLVLEFMQQGDTLSGTVTQMDVDGSNSFARSIIDGKIKGNVVSFYTQGETTWFEGTRLYKESYFGRLNKNKDEIAFKRLNDVPSGGVSETFVAKRN
jgi:flagellar hook assembly protein FlgD